MAWTTYGHSQRLRLPAVLSKTWLADTDFWEYWVFINKPKPNTSHKWVCLKKELVWGNEIAFQPMTDALDARFRVEQTDPLKSNKLSEEETRAGISSPLRQISLSAQDIGSLEHQRSRLTTTSGANFISTQLWRASRRLEDAFS